MEEWKSPRKIEEEVQEYRLKRFEDYMQMVDKGELTKELAFTALREEIEYQDYVSGLSDGIRRRR